MLSSAFTGAFLIGASIWLWPSAWAVLLRGTGLLGILLSIWVGARSSVTSPPARLRWHALVFAVGCSGLQVYLAVQYVSPQPILAAACLAFGAAYLVIGISIFSRRARESHEAVALSEGPSPPGEAAP